MIKKDINDNQKLPPKLIEALEAYHRYREIAGCIKIFPELNGFSYIDFFIMCFVTKEGLPIKYFSLKLGGINLTYMMKKLADQGLIKSKDCKKNKKLTLISLTPLGESIKKKIYDVLNNEA
ncbi:MAG TPA: hypothetical protein VHA52_10115 [Candidatus Babeliaceae bacterium]|nr:hypothetical protein [Candidatus Babeliaceae bacterium]